MFFMRHWFISRIESEKTALFYGQSVVHCITAVIVHTYVVANTDYLESQIGFSVSRSCYM